MQRSELVDYLDTFLQIADIQDYGPQGLQIEGSATLHKIVGMVDAQLPCVAAALDHGATLAQEPHHPPHGGRSAAVRDAEGNLWNVDSYPGE